MQRNNSKWNKSPKNLTTNERTYWRHLVGSYIGPHRWFDDVSSLEYKISFHLVKMVLVLAWILDSSPSLFFPFSLVFSLLLLLSIKSLSQKSQKFSPSLFFLKLAFYLSKPHPWFFHQKLSLILTLYFPSSSSTSHNLPLSLFSKL